MTWDTTKNTASVSFTDSYHTAVLQPSGTDQYAIGFFRNNNSTSGRRYLELEVVDAGGDPTKLRIGFVLGKTPQQPFTPPSSSDLGTLFNSVYNDGGEQYTLRNGSLTYVGLTTTTPLVAGDRIGLLFSWEPDMSWRNVSNSVVNSGTSTSFVTSAIGIVPLFNCTPYSGQVQTYWFRGGALGYYGWLAPCVARSPSSASAAVVSMKTETASFACPIPAGAVAWGDGPQGGGITPAITGLTWDPNYVPDDCTLTYGNMGFVIPADHSLSFATYLVQRSTPFTPSGKKVVEIIGFVGDVPYPTGSITTSSSTIYSQGCRFLFGMSDASWTTKQFNVSSSASDEYNSILWADGWARTPIGTVVRRGSDISASYINVAMGISSPTMNGRIQYWDFDNEKVWGRAGPAAANGLSSFWSGRTLSVAADGPNPWTNTDGHTFTSSGDMRVIALDGNDTGYYSHVNMCLLNVGQQPFRTFPLLPGWESLDGSRYGYGTTEYWDVGAGTSSMSFCFSSVGFRTYLCSSGLHFARSINAQSSGKKYFEIFSDEGWGSGSSPWGNGIIGLAPASTTLSVVSIDSIGATSLLCDMASRHRQRYGAGTTTYSHSSTFVSFISSTNVRAGVAVDFDNGYIWWGWYDPTNNIVHWAKNADPVSGVNPDLTFTAGTSLHIIANASVGGPDPHGWTYLIADEGNLPGLPSGFEAWGGNIQVSATATPSGASPSGVLWPYGVQT